MTCDDLILLQPELPPLAPSPPFGLSSHTPKRQTRTPENPRSRCFSPPSSHDGANARASDTAEPLRCGVEKWLSEQQTMPSLASLVDLGEETLKDLLPHPFAFVDARNHFLDFADAALFVVAVNAGQVQFAEQFFHPGFGSVIFSSIVFIQQSPLLRG